MDTTITVQTNAPPGSGVIALAGGEGFSLGLKLKSDGTVEVWGGPYYRTNVPAGLSGVAAISANDNRALALLSNGNIVGWGYDCVGCPYHYMVPGDAVAVAAGVFHDLAARSDGTVLAWGNNGYGQTNVPAGLSNVVGVAAGLWHSLALKADGTVVAWGDDRFAQTDVPSGLSGVIAISSRDISSAALKSDGTVVTWGYPLGQNPVPGLSHVVAIATGVDHYLALRSDGSVVRWGGNSWGQAFLPVPVFYDHAIQDAVNVANDGDTILVAPGVYFRTNPITITKAISLRSTIGGRGDLPDR